MTLLLLLVIILILQLILYIIEYIISREEKKIIPSRLRQRQASRPTVDAAQGYLSGLKCSFSPEI